jgi:hypothetical protein
MTERTICGSETVYIFINLLDLNTIWTRQLLPLCLRDEKETAREWSFLEEDISDCDGQLESRGCSQWTV